ncbi:MAG: hypothetical protein ACI837_000618 [Crocinitomicaceae bacterium]|jgi:hypothetical protein
MKLLLMLTFFSGFFSTNVNAQTTWNKTIFELATPSEITTLEIQLGSHTANQIGALKDELIQYDEKVLSVQIKGNADFMLLTYNDKMLLEDLISAFKNNGFAYLITPKISDGIINSEEL